MTENHYKQALEAARKESEELIREARMMAVKLQQTESRIVQLEKTIIALESLSEEEPIEGKSDVADDASDSLSDLGLADACREVLKSKARFMTPIEIRDTLASQGYELAKYTNPLASIHGVLKRFEASGIVYSTEIGNKATYRWDIRVTSKQEDDVRATHALEYAAKIIRKTPNIEEKQRSDVLRQIAKTTTKEQKE